MDFDFTTETITPDTTNLLTIGGTGGLELPIGTTLERPIVGLSNGTMRYNTDLNLVETYSNSSWTSAVNPGTVTSVSGSGGSTGLTLSGGPITGTGTLTLGGILDPANGGTGTNTSTATNGQLLIGNGTGLTLSTLTAGTAISVTNGSGSITVNNTGVTSAIGTAGNITVSSATGAVTFNLATAGTPVSNSFVKITTDTFGRVTATSAVVAGDITPLVDGTYVNVTGDTMSGNLVMSGGSTQITLPNAPVAGTDATNKNYVDSAIAGLSWKQAARAATVVAGTLATSFENGDTIDGVVLATNDRILIKNQAAQTENGIYIVQATGAPVRSSDADIGSELVGASVYIDQGTVNENSGWTQTTNAPITIGATNIVWSQFSGSGSFTAGTGLTLTGNTFSLTSPVLATLGGTGQTVYVVGDILFANTTTTLARLAGVVTGNALISGGVGVAPLWGKIGLTTHISGILPVANGGTNLATAPTNGQFLIGNGTGYTLATLTGTAGNITVTNGAGSSTLNLATAGTAGTYGAVTTDTFGRVTSGLVINPVANGGTGLSATPTNGQIDIGNGTGFTRTTITAGAGVTVTNGAGTITIAASAGTGTVTSVALALPSFITVSGSPVTTSGTLTGTLATQTANTLFAGPTTGGPAAPTFRTLVFNDISSALQLYRENPSAPVTPVASGANSVAIGSRSSSTAESAVAIGAGTAANVANIFAYANGNFVTAGDAQNITVMSRNTTVNATVTELFVNGTSQRLVMPNNSVWTFNIRVVGRRTDATGGWAMYTFQGGTKRDATAASTTLEGSSRTIIDESNGALNCTISADTTNGSLNINVTGIAAQTYRWVATTEITQVTN